MNILFEQGVYAIVEERVLDYDIEKFKGDKLIRPELDILVEIDKKRNHIRDEQHKSLQALQKMTKWKQLNVENNGICQLLAYIYRDIVDEFDRLKK